MLDSSTDGYVKVCPVVFCTSKCVEDIPEENLTVNTDIQSRKLVVQKRRKVTQDNIKSNNRYSFYFPRMLVCHMCVRVWPHVLFVH